MSKFKKPARLAVLLAALLVGSLAIGCGGDTSPAAPPIIVRPTVPPALVVESGLVNRLAASWVAVENALDYEVRFHTGVDVDYEYVDYFFTPYTTAFIDGLESGALYSVWVRARFGENNFGAWVNRAVGATYPFTQAFDIVVVGAGAAGAAAVIGARSVGYETPQFESPASNDARWMTTDYWNDMNVLLLEKRAIWGGMTNTAGSGNAWSGPGAAATHFGNMSQTLAAGEDFAAFRTRFSRHIMSNHAIGPTQAVIPEVADNAAHGNHIPLLPGYPNWSKSFALFQQMNHINRWIGFRGGNNGFGAGFGNTLVNSQTYILLARIHGTGLAHVRLDTKATDLITTGPANNAESVTGVLARTVVGNTAGGVMDGSGSVFGTLSGPEQRIAARKVIITSGGFSNLNYREAAEAGLLQGPLAEAAAQAFFGTGRVNSYGTGIAMAVRAGAAITDNFGALTSFGPAFAQHLLGLQIPGETGTWGSFFVNPGFFAGGPIWRIPQIIVNNEGRRFRAEETFFSGVGDGITTTDAQSRDMVVNHWPAWAIFSSVDMGPNISAGGITDMPRGEVLETVWDFLLTTPPDDIRRMDIARGTTLLGLAESMGIPLAYRQYFVDEIVAYDAAVRVAIGGDPWVDPLTVENHPNRRIGQGRAAGEGNANLIRFLTGPDPDGTETGVFWAVRVNPTVWDTLGGLATDIWGRVLREELPRVGGSGAGFTAPFNTYHIVPQNPAHIILNLYAAGAAANRSFYGEQYQSMSSLGMAPTQGVLSGFHAARSILGKPHSLPTGNWDAVVFE